MVLKIKSLLGSPVARNSGIMFVGTMATNVGAYLYQVVVVRILGPEQYSEFAALISLLFLLSVPANVLQIVLTKYFSIQKARNELGETRALLVKALKYIGIFGVAGFPVYMMFIPALKNLLHIYSTDSFLYLYLIVVSSFVVTTFGGLLNGYQKFFSSSAILTLLTFVRLITGFVFAPISVALTIFGNAIANIVSFVFYAFSLKFVFDTPPEKITIKKSEIVTYAVPVLLSTLGMTVFFNIDVVLVKHFFDATQAGIYASLTVFGKIVFFAASPIMIVVFPMIIERKEQKKQYNSLFLLGFAGVVFLSLAIVVCYFFSAQYVIKLLFGEEFMSAAPYLGAYGLFMAFVTIINYLMTVCLAVNKTKAGIIVLAGACVESIVIILFHSSLSQIISSISLVSGALIGILLLYYRYDPST